MLSEGDIRLVHALTTADSKHGQALINQGLSQITRYQGLEMVHPSNVANHQRMVHVIALNVSINWAEEMGIYCDIEPAVVIEMARFHDDHEVDPLIGDIPANEKDKMTPEEIADLKKREKRAHIQIATDYYGLDPNSIEFTRFMQMKNELDTLATLEAECTKTADTLHAIWETLHECIAGNTTFYPVLERYQTASQQLALRSPIWNIIRAHPKIQLDPSHFPTIEQVRTLPRITREFIAGINAEKYSTWEEFNRAMHNPLYPAWYGTGFDLTLLAFGIDGTAQMLFPNWRHGFYPDEEIDEQSLGI